ncbi:hypothetical protein GCM10009127_13480 [Alteraurantiacibacter aestuarii]
MVAIWERGKPQPDWQRALEIVAAGEECGDAEHLRTLTLGERNARLFALRKATIGPIMRAFVKCPQCSEPLEFEQSIDELLDGNAAAPQREFSFAIDGYTLHCRLHDSTDIAHTADLFFEEEIAEALVDRALLKAEHAGETLPSAALSDSMRAAIAREVAARDPLSRPGVALGCAACEHVWQAPLDIAAFFWTEIERLARTTLDDVIALARGYGWRENDILEMGASRRQLYLEALE